MDFCDRIDIAGTRRRAEDGALIVDARVARTGIQIYNGFEVGRPDLAAVRVFRPETEVFARDTMASFAHRVVTNDHPREFVTVDNWSKYAKGGTSSEVARDGDYIRVPLMVSDGEAIKSIEGGKRELSAGYACDLEWTAGTAPDGATYDAVQRNIRANHVAIVDKGRAGSLARIGDSDHQPKETTMSTKTITFDGLPILATDASEAVITKLSAQLRDATAQIATMQTTHQAALTAKDTEIGKLTADLASAKASTTPDALAKMVADRTAVLGIASKVIQNFDASKVAGLDIASIQRGIVIAKYGADFVKDRNADQIAGIFEVIARDAGTAATPTADADPFRVALNTPQLPGATGDPRQKSFDAYTKSVGNMTAAWQNPNGATPTVN
jgi:uncharacterized protein